MVRQMGTTLGSQMVSKLDVMTAVLMVEKMVSTMGLLLDVLME